jgi:hypothetical protein
MTDASVIGIPQESVHLRLETFLVRINDREVISKEQMRDMPGPRLATLYMLQRQRHFFRAVSFGHSLNTSQTQAAANLVLSPCIVAASSSGHEYTLTGHKHKSRHVVASASLCQPCTTR